MSRLPQPPLPPQFAVRSVFANGTFNLYVDPNEQQRMIEQSHMAPAHASSQQQTLPLALYTQDNSKQQHVVHQHVQQQPPRFVHTYNRLIFQNPRMHNLEQALMAQPYPIPVQVRHPFMMPPPPPSLSLTDKQGTVHGGFPYAVVPSSRLRHYRDDRHIYNESGPNAAFWESCDSSDCSLHDKMVSSRVSAKGDPSSQIEKPSQLERGQPNIEQNDMEENVLDSSGESDKDSIQSDDSVEVGSRSRTDNTRSQLIPGKAGTRRTRRGRSDKDYIEEATTTLQQKNKEAIPQSYRVHDRPLYERYQEAFQDSVKRGEYWRRKAARQIRLSDNIKAQLLPYLEDERSPKLQHDYFAAAAAAGTAANPVQAQQLAMTHINYPVAGGPAHILQFPPTAMSPIVAPPYFNYAVNREYPRADMFQHESGAFRDPKDPRAGMAKLEKKVQALSMQVKTMRKEISQNKIGIADTSDQKKGEMSKMEEGIETTRSVEAESNSAVKATLARKKSQRMSTRNRVDESNKMKRTGGQHYKYGDAMITNPYPAARHHGQRSKKVRRWIPPLAGADMDMSFYPLQDLSQWGEIAASSDSKEGMFQPGQFGQAVETDRFHRRREHESSLKRNSVRRQTSKRKPKKLDAGSDVMAQEEDVKIPEASPAK